MSENEDKKGWFDRKENVRIVVSAGVIVAIAGIVCWFAKLSLPFPAGYLTMAGLLFGLGVGARYIMIEGWFDHKENVRKVIFGLFIVCAGFVVVDIIFWITKFDKHPYFKWETWPGFYAVYGFVACVLLVLVSRYILRPLVMRGEEYYEKDDSK